MVDNLAMGIFVPMPKQSKRHTSFVAGLGALVSLWPAGHTYRYPHSSSMGALRSDASRTGDDMRRVIRREHARIKETSE